jgi:hypothetical protein
MTTFHFLKSKCNPSQHGFTKPESSVTDLVTFFDFVTPSICSQSQADSINFDFSSVCDIISHLWLLHKPNYCGLSPRYLYLNFWAVAF